MTPQLTLVAHIQFIGLDAVLLIDVHSYVSDVTL